MAITRVGVMANPPTNIGDYTHILAHLDAYAKQVGNQGMLLTQWGNASGVPAIAKGSYISHGGTLFVVDTEDFLVAAPASNGTYYLRVAGSGASLAISWVTSIGGYTWNAIYNGLYDGSENQILPYMLIKTGAVLEKWKISNLMQGGNFNRVDYLGRVIMGALTCASVDTGSGPISGASVAVTGNATVGGTLGFASLNPGSSTETSIQISAGQSQVLPKGAYALNLGASASCDMKYGSNWITIFRNPGGFVISDGVNFRWLNQSTETSTANIRKL